MEHTRRWDLWLALAGLAVAGFDFTVFAVLGIDMTIAGSDVTRGLFVWFAVSYAIFGFVIGRLVQARARAREAARTIQDQLRALEASQRALVEAEKLAAIGRLAAGMAHEVRNPLGVIRASASMVRESFAPGEEAYRACGFIQDEIDRLNGLIAALLRFARPTELRRRMFALEKVIDRALELCAAAAAERRVRVARESRGSVPPVSGDPDLLTQVVLNLVTNAIDAVEPGGTIEIGAWADSVRVGLDVRDDGPGVAREAAGRLFEPFFTTKASGTGLGLAMAARIAEAHAGRLELVAPGDEDPARGACFRLTLPVGTPEPAGAAT